MLTYNVNTTYILVQSANLCEYSGNITEVYAKSATFVYSTGQLS